MWFRKRPQAKPKTTTDPYRSGLERKIALSLQARGISFSYESEKLDFRIERTAKYLPDFILQGPNGKIYVEAKGYLTSADRSKMVRVKKSNPQADIRFVFGKSSNRLNKKSPTTYADWATKNGFPWAEKEIPDEWIT